MTPCACCNCVWQVSRATSHGLCTPVVLRCCPPEARSPSGPRPPRRTEERGGREREGERERGSEGVRERKERGRKWKHQGSAEEAFPLRCLPLSRCHGSFRRLLASIVMASFSQRRSGGAGPPFKAAAGDCLRLVQCNSGYLRPPHTVLTGACRYTTRGRVAPPAPLSLYCRGQLARRDTSTRSSRHSILIPGPVWIYYRLGTLGMCGRAIMVSRGRPSQYCCYTTRWDAGQGSVSWNFTLRASTVVLCLECGSQRQEICALLSAIAISLDQTVPAR